MNEWLKHPEAGKFLRNGIRTNVNTQARSRAVCKKSAVRVENQLSPELDYETKQNNKMSIIQNNPLTKGLSGMLGLTIVFKQLRGKTIMAKRPAPSATQSELQKGNRMKFKMATQYAQLAMKDPVKKEFYWKKARRLKLPNAYTAAITDYLRKAEIKRVDTKSYQGNAGDRITIHVRKKDFHIAEVSVTLLTLNDQKIEGGMAIRNDDGYWIYKSGVSGIDQGAVQIRVTVKDQVGHINVLMC